MALNGEAPRAQFARADTDGSGALDATELAALFESMGKPVSVGAPRNLLHSRGIKYITRTTHSEALIVRGTGYDVGLDGATFSRDRSVGAPRNLLNLYVTHVLSRGTYL
jgi:hypothetical protein